MFAYVSFRYRDLHAFADLMRAGTRGILLQGVSDEPQSLRETLSTAVAQTTPGEALVMLTPLVPRPAMSFVAYVATHAHRPLSVTRAVRDVSAARRTIADALAHRACHPACDSSAGFASCMRRPCCRSAPVKSRMWRLRFSFPPLRRWTTYSINTSAGPQKAYVVPMAATLASTVLAEIRAGRAADTTSNGDSVTSKQALTRTSLDSAVAASGLLAE